MLRKKIQDNRINNSNANNSNANNSNVNNSNANLIPISDFGDGFNNIVSEKDARKQKLMAKIEANKFYKKLSKENKEFEGDLLSKLLKKNTGEENVEIPQFKIDSLEDTILTVDIASMPVVPVMDVEKLKREKEELERLEKEKEELERLERVKNSRAIIENALLKEKEDYKNVCTVVDE